MISKLHTIKQIQLYPIKGMGGISVHSTKALQEGIQWDRHWMLVDEEGTFQTQRELRFMVHFKTALKDEGVEVSYKEEKILLPFIHTKEGERTVQIWEHTLIADVCKTELSEWFSEHLGKQLQLVCLKAKTPRIKKIRVAPDEVAIRFSDGYPYTILGTASVELLNSKLEEALPETRFRSTIIVETDTPHAEDTWTDFQINGLDFRMVKPCSRCVVTTINQDTGSTSKEPLKTLSSYRREGNYVNFTMNAICLTEGVISVGDKFTV